MLQEDTTGNKAKGHMSKRRYQENKVQGYEMFVFRKAWHICFLVTSVLRFPFCLLPTAQSNNGTKDTLLQVYNVCQEKL